MKYLLGLSLLVSFNISAQSFSGADLLDIHIANSGLDNKKIKEYVKEGSPTAGKNKCLQGSMRFVKPKLEGLSPFFIIKNNGSYVVGIGQSCVFLTCDSDFMASSKVEFPPVFVERGRSNSGTRRIVFKGDFSGVNSPAIDLERGTVLITKEGKFKSQHFDDPVKNLRFEGLLETVHTFNCNENAASGSGTSSPVKDKTGGSGNAGAQ